MAKHWVAVAAAEHVHRALADGFIQVCHGKAAPLRRISPGDGVAVYSPTARFRGRDRLQAFTALGVVKPGEPGQINLGGGCHPYRREIAWSEAEEAPIRPLLDVLGFTAENPNWGYRLRSGLLRVSAHDFWVIASAMHADLAC